MDRKIVITFIAIYSLVAGMGFFLSGYPQAEATPVVEQSASYILQGESTEVVAEVVRSIGGEITHELGIINAVAAKLSRSQLEQLRVNPAILKITEDGAVKTAGGVAGGSPGAYAHFPALVGADQVHNNGITGRSLTVAILDSGMHAEAELQKDTDGVTRVVDRYNAIQDTQGEILLDKYGHGSHLTSIILNTDYADDGSMRRNSIAPDVKIVPVKAFNRTGSGSYATVILGLD